MSIIQAFQAVSGGIVIPPAEVISAVTYISPGSSAPQWPSGLQSGDIVYFVGVNVFDDTSIYVPSSLTGWNTEFSDTGVRLYSYESNGTESGSISVSGGDLTATVNIIAMSNVVRSPADESRNVTGVSPVSTLSVNAASDGSILVCVFCGIQYGSNSWSVPAGMTAFTGNGASAFGSSNSGAYELGITSGATGARTSSIAEFTIADLQIAFVVTPLNAA